MFLAFDLFFLNVEGFDYEYSNDAVLFIIINCIIVTFTRTTSFTNLFKIHKSIKSFLFFNDYSTDLKILFSKHLLTQKI